MKYVARMRLYRGAPTIYVNDRPVHGGFVGTRGGSHFLAAEPEGVAPLTHDVLLWSEAVKRGTNGESLTASPAAVMDVGLHTDLHGHLPENTVAGYLASPHLGMVESPASYALRDLGRGDTTFLQPMGSVQLAAKMQMRDFDTRTSLTSWKGEEFPKCRLWQPPADAWGDVQVLLRDTAYSLMKNGAFW